MTAEGRPVTTDARAGAGCAAVRLAGGEPLLATAPESEAAWLLVEHPGPWPAVGPPAGLPGEVHRLWEAVERAGIECYWIRPSRNRRTTPITVFTAGTRQGATWLERTTLGDLGGLTRLDVAALIEGRPPGFGSRSSESVVLVCTHGRRDVCCARLGRPVVEGLRRRLPGQVWEVSHIGGHRFAANVVSLPDGVFHGGVTAADTAELADALVEGNVLPHRLRGRAGLPAAVQAAEYYARIGYGVRAVDGVVPLRQDRRSEDGTVRVELRLGDATVCVVHVRPRLLPVGRATACAPAGHGGPRATFDLVAFEHGTGTAA
ncbi:sucrase ferredoxin [Amycolatopsis lurida]